MWVARDKSGRLRLFTCYKPLLDNDCEEPWTTWMTDENPITTECEIDGNLFPNLTYEDEPIEVELNEIIDKSNPTTFESCGNHLRNLLGPYQTLIDIVTMFTCGDMPYEMFCKLIKNSDYENNLKNIIEFSKTNKLENINWR